jgi:tetratricopeptide (TPR) repeat protein
LEITDRNEFLQAWLTGAKEWRENTSRNQSTFLPMRDCWQAFTPVQLPGSGGAVALPEEKKIVDAYITQVSRFIDSEIEEQVTILQQEIRNTRESARSVNKLGVLYARYELWDKAEAQFARILGREQYVPALLNMGNIQARRGNSEKALEYYSQASRRDPTDAKVVLAIARINHDMENYGEVSKLYRKLKEMSPSLAAEYAYLDLRGEEAARAAEAINTGGKVLWDED